MLNKLTRKAVRYNREKSKDLQTMKIERAMFIGTLV
jgi:hypothetical protein